MTPIKTFYKNQAESIIKKLNMRKMDGYYCNNVEEARAKLVELLGQGKKSVAYGGSMTLDENGFKDAVTAAGHELVIRENYKTPEEVKECNAKQINAYAFLMSTNAITLDGELVNIDGRGNRVCYLIYGPQNVIVVAGWNKIETDLEGAIKRARNVAAPPNCIRLNKNTPCIKNGHCNDCFSPDCICSQFVVTRRSSVPDRIKVILVGENLGY